MHKWVVLKLDGDLFDWVRVTLEIGAEGDRAAVEVRGNLPPNPDLVTYYERWQSTYCSLEDFRITPIGISIGGDRTEELNHCRFLGKELSKHLNSWLNWDSFRPIKEKLLQQLTLDDTVRILVKTDDIWLRRLPWQLWDFLEDYSKAEVALSAPEYEILPSSNPDHAKSKVKILAILGNSEGISIQKDRELLEKLPDAQVTFLVEPQRSKLCEKLWEQNWDILFFAGHSSSQEDGKTGHIFINQTEQLSINELRYALKQAARGGLHLAIFNSCDGLGLARQLEDLQIPQIIVMREPVPDRVAQEFLKNFLTGFSSGESLYLAVRQSRERLHGIEDKYPCATWLPVICQHPAALAPTWQQLCGHDQKTTKGKAKQQNNSFLPRASYLKTLLLSSIAVTALVMGVRFLGLLQPLELQAFDRLMRLRPTEGPDRRLLLVTISENDFRLPQQQHRIGSLSDRSLALLLQKLEKFKPRAIGLDIYRDFPVDSKEANLATQMRQSDRFIAICRVSDPEVNDPGVAPPPEIPTQRQGFSDFVQDSDGIIRRHLIAMKPSSQSPCTTPYALSARLAFRYLEDLGISVKYTQNKELQIGNVVFKRLLKHMGGYQQVDDWGYQVLLNYRSSSSLFKFAEQITLKDVLTGSIKPSAVKNRVVLIGVTSESASDFLPTPYSTSQKLDQKMPGVIVHAQMVSQILGAVLDGRPLLWVWSLWQETLWVFCWSVVGGILVWRIQNPVRLGIAIVVSCGVLSGLSVSLLSQGGWVPLVPPALALVFTGTSAIAYNASQSVNSSVNSKSS